MINVMKRWARFFFMYLVFGWQSESFVSLSLCNANLPRWRLKFRSMKAACFVSALILNAVSRDHIFHLYISIYMIYIGSTRCWKTIDKGELPFSLSCNMWSCWANAPMKLSDTLSHAAGKPCWLGEHAAVVLHPAIKITVPFEFCIPTYYSE